MYVLRILHKYQAQPYKISSSGRPCYGISAPLVMITFRRLRWAGHVAHKRHVTSGYRILVLTLR